MKKNNDSIEDNRKLTKAEEKRKKQYETLKEKMISEGYEEKDLTISVVYANIMAFVTAIPFFIVFGFLFYIRGNSFSFNQDGVMGNLFIIFAFIISIVIHEWIHGISWAVFAENHFKSIEFGFIKEYLTPYCTCKSVLKKSHYIIGAIMPTVILGILPCIISLFTGNSSLLYYGFLMILSGGGDMTIILNILKFKYSGKEVLLLDHPYKCGSIVFEK